MEHNRLTSKVRSEDLSSRYLFEGRYGGIAQLGEHLLCKQGVCGSIPHISTNPFFMKDKTTGASMNAKQNCSREEYGLAKRRTDTKKWARSSGG